MKIVVLDGYTANPGDLSWDAFGALGEVTVHERTPPELLHDRAAGAEILLTNKVVLDSRAISQLPGLRYIGVLATGYNVVDAAAAHARGITVCNVPEYSTANVAQAVFALILEVTNRTGHHSATVREGKWSSSLDWCYWDYPLVELAGRTLGILGIGKIGAIVARIGSAFGMTVIASRRSGGQASGSVRLVDTDTLFRESDVLSLHCPLTDDTRGIINSSRLAAMKAQAILINTARGPLVDEAALAAALNEDRLAGAGLDVLSVEPPATSNPLLSAKNCVITPHIAWATREARARLLQIAAENVRLWQRGAPRNVVSS